MSSRKRNRQYGWRPKTATMSDNEFDTLLHNVHINDERLRQAAVESYTHPQLTGRNRRYRLLAHPSAIASPVFLRYMTDQWRTDSRADKAEVYVSATAAALLAQQSGDPVGFYRDELITLSEYSPDERRTYSANHHSGTAKRIQILRAWNRAMVNESTACPTELVDAIARLILPFEAKNPSPLVVLPKDTSIHDTVERRQEYFSGQGLLSPSSYFLSTDMYDALGLVARHPNTSNATRRLLARKIILVLDKSFSSGLLNLPPTAVHAPIINLLTSMLEEGKPLPPDVLVWACERGSPGMRRAAVIHRNTPETVAIMTALTL